MAESSSNNTDSGVGKKKADVRNLMIDGVPLSVFMGDYNVPDDAPPSVWIPLSEWEDFKAGDRMFVGGDFDMEVGDEGHEIHEKHGNFDQEGQAVKVQGMIGTYWFVCNNKNQAKILDTEGVDYIVNVQCVTAAVV